MDHLVVANSILDLLPYQQHQNNSNIPGIQFWSTGDFAPITLEGAKLLEHIQANYL